ncbi:hypothetical protein EC990816_2560 [Escherichia coli 99.0816]|nr:hypothetical protein EC990816_2560 [Escherichia coli 99.0816]
MNTCHGCYLRVCESIHRLIESVCLAHDSEHHLNRPGNPGD